MLKMLDLKTCKAADLEALWKEKGSGFTEASLKQTRVGLGKLRVAPNVFQPRDDGEAPWEKEKHVRNLADAPKAGTALDPITIFPVAGMFVVVDGHCRLKAYQEAKWKGNVPVHILKGTFIDALLHAAEANSKDKLPLTHGEKLEAAWRLVLYDETREEHLSTRRMEDATQVSKSTIGNMRKKLQESPKGSPGDPRGKTWREVVRGAWDGGDRDADAWMEQAINDCAVKLRRALGKLPDKNPDILTAAIEKAYPRAYRAVLEQAAHSHPDEVDEIRADALESDF